MSESDLTAWFIVIILPIVVSIGGLLLKIGADKRNQENRITKVESRLDEHATDITELKEIKTELNEYRSLLIRVDERTASQTELLGRLMDRLDRAEEEKRNGK